jgi:beta-phosphoglucomutase-like phosphatase (HAD superfamily)
MGTIMSDRRVQWHFDFDGTLFFTHDLLLQSYEDAVIQMGGEFTNSAKLALVKGESYLDFLKLCLWDQEQPNFGTVRAKKNDIYLDNLGLVIPNWPLLETALSLAPNISIVTSSGRLSVEGVLKHFGLQHYFTNIVSAEDVSKLKPDPEPYLLSISRDPSAVHVAIDDSDFGVESAHEAGLLVFHYKANFQLNSLR